MADNYLEKKMEEHRNNAKAPVKRYITIARKPTPELDGKRVFVTSGAHGVGAAIVKALRAEGCKVAFCDMNTKTGYEVAQKTGARFYPIDMHSKQAVEKCQNDVREYYGDIDVIVNNMHPEAEE
jgi:NAD(P)-dependent dehydrogenase (short-subunit alcohol dehydrogenase family)